uniref:C3H1-type domain-containing protein n=1 Tax=Davidia involucrata TaxID=16924 RepID=A0A5B6YYC1_DAVIN
MEGLYATSSSKLKALNGNVSPINAQRDNHQFFLGGGCYHRPSKSPSVDPYASIDSSNLENFDSTLIRYLRSGSPASASSGDAPKYRSMIGNQYHSSKSNTSGSSSSGFGLRRSSSVSPLSAIENLETPPSRSPPVFKTPVKVEEDVLVMDGILVGSVPSARVRSLASSDSSGSSSPGSKSLYKTEICRPWEDSGSCRYGSKCQFAHGKEELRPSRFHNKNKSETCKSFTSLGSCTYGAKCRFVHHQVMTAPPLIEPAAAVAAVTQTVSPTKSEQASSGSGTITFTSSDWSPQDDGIEVALPSSVSADKTPSREDVDAYLHSVLYGPIRRKRLPVFAEICPE